MEVMTVRSNAMNGNISIINSKALMHGNVLISWSTENPYLQRFSHQSPQVLSERQYTMQLSFLNYKKASFYFWWHCLNLMIWQPFALYTFAFWHLWPFAIHHVLYLESVSYIDHQTLLPIYDVGTFNVVLHQLSSYFHQISS